MENGMDEAFPLRANLFEHDEGDDDLGDDAPIHGSAYWQMVPLLSEISKCVSTKGDLDYLNAKMHEIHKELLTRAANRVGAPQQVASSGGMLSLPEIDTHAYDYRERQLCSPSNKRPRHSRRRNAII